MYVEHNKYIGIKIKHETWIAKQFIATYVRNLNYKTTCFGLWRPSSGQDSGILKQEKSLAETCRFIIKIPYISCNKLFCNSCLVFNLNSYTGCHRRNGPNFGRVYLMLNYTDITQNTWYIQSWTVTEIMAREVWNFDSCYTLTDYQIHIETGRNMWFL